jgi:hypothetical protein
MNALQNALMDIQISTPFKFVRFVIIDAELVREKASNNVLTVFYQTF